MKTVRFTIAACLLALASFCCAPASGQTVHAGADTDTKILINQPGYVHEVIQDSHTGWIYTEANAHSWLPNPTMKALEAKAHAKRFHLDMPWPIPDVQWTSCWTRCVLRDGYSPKSAAAKASAWGSWFIIDGPPGELAELRARIPGRGSVPYDPPPSGHYVPQGLACDSFFDIFTDVNVQVNPGGGWQELLAIKGKLGGVASAEPGLTFAVGEWASSFFAEEDVVLPDGIRKQAYVRTDILSPATVSPKAMAWHRARGLSASRACTLAASTACSSTACGRPG